MKKEEEKEEKTEEEKGEEAIIENLHVRRVNKALWERFKGAVAMKTGKMHGVLGKELEEALALYLDMIDESEGGVVSTKSVTHAHKQRVKSEKKNIDEENRMYAKIYPQNSRQRRMNEVGRIILRGGRTKVTRKELERLVHLQDISTQRTVEEYIHQMVEKGWIYRTTGTGYSVNLQIISEQFKVSLSDGYYKKQIDAPHQDSGKKINGF